MLNLIFQKAKAKDVSKVRVDVRAFFAREKKAEWFADPFVQQVMRAVDHAEQIDGFVLKDGEGNVIPPEYLSTGTKTAICIYEFPDMIFNATQMGDNALEFILDLALERDITILVYRLLPYRGLLGLDIYKDYQLVKFRDDVDFYDQMNIWLEEIYHD